MMSITQQKNLEEQAREAAIVVNNNLHRANIHYLELASSSLQIDKPREAARFLRLFVRIERLRRRERERLTDMPSPHEIRQAVLKSELRRAVAYVTREREAVSA